MIPPTKRAVRLLRLTIKRDALWQRWILEKAQGLQGDALVLPFSEVRLMRVFGSPNSPGPIGPEIPAPTPLHRTGYDRSLRGGWIYALLDGPELAGARRS